MDICRWLNGAVSYGTVALLVSRTTGNAILTRGQELSYGQQVRTIKISANVVDTARPAVAGAERHPGWHALRTLAARITTPLLPDDYLKLANPLWSARELRGRFWRSAARPRTPRPW